MSGNREPVNHHSDDTRGEKAILIEFVAAMVPHDSPEFLERKRLGRPAGSPPIPDYLKAQSRGESSSND